MDYLGLVQVGESGLVIGSCTCENYFGIQYRMKVILDLVPGFEIVLVLRILILKQGEVYQSSWACHELGFLAI